MFSSVVSFAFSNLELLSRWFRVGLRISVDGVFSIVFYRGEGWLARHSTIKKMGSPHRLDI